ncbi:MAG: MATE family efflux transporter [Xanthomonadales bacterium]|nr:MATE family efflux transporter [Xanthomonadales bacterium]
MSGADSPIAEVSHRSIWARAWPIILANAATPLLGLADTAVIGNTGSVANLGSIALGALLFNFLYWGFGFLRMGTTGFTAQADGAGDQGEVRAVLARSLLLAVSIALLLLVLQAPLISLATALFSASAEVEQGAEVYFHWRILGAPAALATFTLMGTLIGLGRSGLLLRVQLLLNGLNIALDLLFAAGLGWGVEGIAIGTATAEWVTLLFAAGWVLKLLDQQRQADQPFWSRASIFDWPAMLRTLSTNRDIFIRTLALLLSFAWFTNQGAQFGDRVLAANHLLMQFIAFSAYFLDGYAFAVESLVGKAIGARDRAGFDAVVRRSSELALATALLLSAILISCGAWLIAGLTDLGPVRMEAQRYLPWAAVYVLLSFAAFQLDGIFIGATRSSEMRNAALAATAVFLLSDWLLTPTWRAHGLWCAFVIYVIVRALTLLLYMPRIRREI